VAEQISKTHEFGSKYNSTDKEILKVPLHNIEDAKPVFIVSNTKGCAL
jgi:hypothetical protein